MKCDTPELSGRSRREPEPIIRWTAIDILGDLALNSRYTEPQLDRLVRLCDDFEAMGGTGVILSDGRAIPCRTLLSAVGLRPERELLLGGPVPNWAILAGNCRRIPPRIEGVLKEGADAAAQALALLS